MKLVWMLRLLLILAPRRWLVLFAQALAMPCTAAMATWNPLIAADVDADVVTIMERPKVSGHASCTFGKGSLFFLWGGLREDRTATNDLWMICNGDDGEPGGGWKKQLPPSNHDSGPGPRMYAAAACLQDNVYVMGGWDPEAKGSGGTFKDEVFSWSSKTGDWKQCDPLPCGPISRHTATTVGEQIIIQTYMEGEEGIVVLQGDGSCRVQATTGSPPTGLSMSAAAAIDDHTLVVCGGSTKTQELSDAVYVLDTLTWVWKKLKHKGDSIPEPITSCSMSALGGATCVVFGGAGIGTEGYEGGRGLLGRNDTWILSVRGDEAHWTLLQPSTKAPPPRVAASLNQYPTDGGVSKILLTGGWNPKTMETYDQDWILTL